MAVRKKTAIDLLVIKDDMLTELAKGEIERLEDMGIRLSPDEIVRLNDYAVEAINKRDYYDQIPTEMRARYGNICFREPTFAHYKFVQECEDLIDSNGVSGVVLRAYASSMDARHLPDHNDTDLVKSQILQFQIMIQYLNPRIIEAVVCWLWVGPHTAPQIKKDLDDKDLYQMRDYVLEQVVSGIALCSGLTLADAMEMRPAVLNSYILQAMKSRNGVDNKGCLGKFYKFVSTLEESHKDEVKR